MTLEDTFVTLMQADTELMALLTGGVYSAIAVGEVSRQYTPAAFDENKEIMPSALVSMGTEVIQGPYHNSVKTPVMVYFYQRIGSDIIEQALNLVYELFNYQKLDGTWLVEHDMSIFNQADQALACSLCLLRFMAVRLR
jgi:hypothetical protein